MNKYLALLRYETKTIVRTPINLFMCLFPVVILLLAAFVFPLIFRSMNPADEAALRIAMLLMLVIILAIGSYFLAAMATFLLLEHKDENSLKTIAVTPLGASGYLRFKMAYVYVMAFLGMLLILIGTKYIAGHHYAIGPLSLFENVSVPEIIAFSAVSTLLVPALALFQGAFAKNKVEGFAFIKGTGLVAVVPVLMVMDVFQGGPQYALGVFPNFWAIKGMMLEFLPIGNAANLSFPFYLLIGAAYSILLIIVAYRLFLKKAAY
jgi:fluoroquinolone transport system permease protein